MRTQKKAEEKSTMTASLNRRNFLKHSALILTAALPLTHLTQVVLAASSQEKNLPPPSGFSPVSESDPVAAAIGYKENVKNIDFTKYPQRKKADAKSQFCNNCALYSTIPGSTAWGKCQMLTSGVVKSKGWCGSWSKKI